MTPHQKHQWQDRGLIIWEATSQTVTYLYADYTLKILKPLKETDAWKTDGFVIGSSAYRITLLNTPDKQSVPIECHQDGWVLINKISLSSEQAEELLMFLVSEEHEIMLIASDEDRDLREACAMVVDLLIELGRKKKVTGKRVARK